MLTWKLNTRVANYSATNFAKFPNLNTGNVIRYKYNWDIPIGIY